MFASEVMLDAAALLNDREQVTWTNTDLLPFLKRAVKEFNLRAKELGIQIVQEISAKLEIPVGKTSITVLDLPDLGYPNMVSERADGSSDTYVPMTELNVDPQITAESSLNYWIWREGEIKLIGATTAREVIVYYKKGLLEVTGTATNLTETDASLFLSGKTAALASALAGGNFERAGVLDNDAEKHIQSYFNSQVKSKQATAPVRHKAYRR